MSVKMDFYTDFIPSRTLDKILMKGELPRIQKITIQNRQYFMVLVFDFSTFLLLTLYPLIFFPIISFMKLFFRYQSRYITPSYVRSAKRLILLTKNYDVIEDEDQKLLAYKILHSREFVYTHSLGKNLKNISKDFENIYDTNTKLFNQHKEKIQEGMSEELKKLDTHLWNSDFKINRQINILMKISTHLFSLCDKFSHEVSDDNWSQIISEIERFKLILNNLERIYIERKKVWAEYEKELNLFLQNKLRKKRYLLALFKDFIPLPFKSLLTLFLKDIGYIIYNNLLGQKAIAKSEEHCKNHFMSINILEEKIFKASLIKRNQSKFSLWNV